MDPYFTKREVQRVITKSLLNSGSTTWYPSLWYMCVVVLCYGWEMLRNWLLMDHVRHESSTR